MANITGDYSSSKTNGAASSSDFKNRMQNPDHSLDKMARNAGDKMGEMASDFAGRTADTWRDTQDYVRENPTKGVAMAVATGVVIGSLLTLALRGRHD